VTSRLGTGKLLTFFYSVEGRKQAGKEEKGERNWRKWHRMTCTVQRQPEVRSREAKERECGTERVICRQGDVGDLACWHSSGQAGLGAGYEGLEINRRKEGWGTDMQGEKERQRQAMTKSGRNKDRQSR
jgi:hypothetical protein